jgi:fumarate reductase subunit D
MVIKMNLFLVEEAERVLREPFTWERFGEGCLQSLICMAIVFLMLVLLVFIVSLFKYLNKKKTFEDKDMAVACLVASIDYHNETKQDVHVVSIKKIQ